MSIFVLPVRVYYEDTDHGGVVYYANYLKFMERCRTEFLRSHGFEQDVLIDENDLIFAVRRIEADYLQPARFNDMLLVTAQIIQKSRVKILFKQQVYKTLVGQQQITTDSVLLCDAKVTIVSLNTASMRPKRMPENILEELMSEY